MEKLSGSALGSEKQADITHAIMIVRDRKSAPTSPLKESVIDQRSESEKDSISDQRSRVKSEEDDVLKETVLDAQDDVRSMEQSEEGSMAKSEEYNVVPTRALHPGSRARSSRHK